MTARAPIPVPVPVPLPAWLREPQSYRPPAGRDAFLDRSLAAVLGLLARLQPRPGGLAGGRPGPDPTVTAGAGLVAILAVALARGPLVPALAGTGLLGVLALQEARVIAGVLRAALAAGLMAALVLVPAALWGPAPAAGGLLVKVLLTAAIARLVAMATGWPALAAVLRRLGVPDPFLLVLDLTLRYLARLGPHALALLGALGLRSVGRQRRGTAVLGAVAGVLFLASLDMAEELEGAMRCRAFTGVYRPAGRVRLGLLELALGGSAGALAAACLLGRA